jgi:hypothetical protein
MDAITFQTGDRRRTDEGLPRIGREAMPLSAFERRLALFCVLLVANGLFVGGVAPPLLVLAMAFACALGEAAMLVDQLLLRRHPLAEVHELRPARRRAS